MSYRHSTTIRLRHTDAAGVLFFAEQLVLVHEAYECFLDEYGFSIRDILQKKDYALPILHAETDFRRPLRIGDEVEIQLVAERIGETSFTLRHVIRQETQVTGQGKTVHGCLDPSTAQKKKLPAELRGVLQAQLVPDDEDEA